MISNKIIERLISEMNHIKKSSEPFTEMKDEYRRGQGRGMIDVANTVLKIIEYYNKAN